MKSSQLIKECVRTIIRHSVFTGSAHVVYLGREEGRENDILISESSDTDLLDNMFEAVQKATEYVRAVDSKIAELIPSINIIAIVPLHSALARRSRELMKIIEESNDAEWRKFVAGLTLQESDMDWQALGVAHRVYEKQLRATYEGGNAPLKRQAKISLHLILRALLEKFDPNTDFSAKALPVMVSICLALLDARERASLEDNLRNLELGQEAPHINFGALKFASEPGYFEREINILNEQIYPFVKDKWMVIQGRATPQACAPPDQSRFLYRSIGEDEELYQQVVKSSSVRQTIYISQGLVEQLIDHPLALAEILIEEIATRINADRPIMYWEQEEKVGRELREQLVQTYKRDHPGQDLPFRLVDILAEGT